MAYHRLINSQRRKTARVDTLYTTTIRDFSGGWNVLDSDLNLSSKYSKVLRNIYRGSDGSNQLRYGTKLFATIDAITDREIINGVYYSNALIVVADTGEVFAINGAGVVVQIWSDGIASGLPGAPSGWGSTDFVSFTQFRGDLIICNGIDKPLIVAPDLSVVYLYDLATGTNINTPICRYVTSNKRYVVMAGDPTLPSILHISNIDTSGTWFGDTAPNDAIQFDVGPFVATGSSIIKGIGTFNQRLVVVFEQCVVLILLGGYVGSGPAVHQPVEEDTITQHGAISHRSLQPLDSDMMMTSIIGVVSLKKSLLTETLAPDHPSHLINPELQKRLQRLSTAALEDRVFTVYNPLEGQIMTFIPNETQGEDITETIGFVYTYIPDLKIRAWSEFRGWNWRAGCASAQGRLFFFKENKVYVYGSREDQYHRDAIYEQEPFSDGTIWTDGTGFGIHSSESDALIEDSGLSIEFDWQMPWADFDVRMNIKKLLYVGMDTKGRGTFTFDLFVDNFLEDRSQQGEPFSDDTIFTDGYGWSNEDPIYAPLLSMDFVGGDAPGFGLQPFGVDHFGGGRRSNDERLFSLPAKGKIFKPRIHGRSRFELQWISISLLYQKGSIRI